MGPVASASACIEMEPEIWKFWLDEGFPATWSHMQRLMYQEYRGHGADYHGHFQGVYDCGSGNLQPAAFLSRGKRCLDSLDAAASNECPPSGLNWLNKFGQPCRNLSISE